MTAIEWTSAHQNSLKSWIQSQPSRTAQQHRDVFHAATSVANPVTTQPTIYAGEVPKGTIAGYLLLQTAINGLPASYALRQEAINPTTQAQFAAEVIVDAIYNSPIEVLSINKAADVDYYSATLTATGLLSSSQVADIIRFGAYPDPTWTATIPAPSPLQAVFAGAEFTFSDVVGSTTGVPLSRFQEAMS